jgi:hypothetical protein
MTVPIELDLENLRVQDVKVPQAHEQLGITWQEELHLLKPGLLNQRLNNIEYYHVVSRFSQT